MSNDANNTLAALNDTLAAMEFLLKAAKELLKYNGVEPPIEVETEEQTFMITYPPYAVYLNYKHKRTTPAPEPTPVTLPITDDFIAPDGTDLNGRTTTTGGAIWQTINPYNFDIQGNEANIVNPDGNVAPLAILNTGVSDNYAVQALMDFSHILSGFADSGVAFRAAADGSDYLAFTYVYNGTALVAHLFSADFSTVVHDYTQSVAEPLGLPRVEVRGNAIQCYIGGLLIFDVTESYLASNTYVGPIDDYNTDPARWDNFLVEVVSPMLVSDNFTDTDGTDLNGRTTTYGGKVWAVSGASGFDIQGNQAHSTSGGGDGWAHFDSGIADFTYQVVLAGASGSGGLIWRRTDDNNHWLLQASGGPAHVYKRVAGDYVDLGAISATTAQGDVVKIVTLGSTHTIYVNGTQVFTTTDAFNSTATQLGFKGFFNNQYFDSLSVTS